MSGGGTPADAGRSPAGSGTGDEADGREGEDPSAAEIEASGGGKLRVTLTNLRRILGGVPAFGKLLYRLLGDSRVSLLDKAIFGGALVYLFVPMDLIPDWVPGLGQMDDLLVVVFTLDRLIHRTDEAVLADNWDGDAGSLSALLGLLDRATGVLPGWARALLRAG